MERDTNEWRRPWTEVPTGPSARPAVGETDTTQPQVGGPTVVRRTQVVRARPSVFAPGTPLDGEPPAEPVAASSDADAVAQDADVIITPLAAGDRASTETYDADSAAPRRFVVPLLAALLGAVLGTGGTLVAVDRAGLFDAQPSAPARADSGERVPVVELPTDGATTVVSAVAAAVLPAVVRIDVLAEQQDAELGLVRTPIGVGSGVIYTSDGYILTNNHVVESADALAVQLADGRELSAELIGTDPLSDLAVLKVDAEGLTAVNLRVDEPLAVGEVAVAIGSPFGLDASVTAGVVSALNRDLTVPGDAGEGSFVIPALIQTDAAINPGNSGGALVDATGRLIGINTAILTGSGGSQGVGFAIPTRRVVASADQLIANGFVSHPFLGIQGLDVTLQVAARYRDEFGIDLEGGALVESVVEGSGAALAGLVPEDVIVELGGRAIGSMTDVIAAILEYATGDRMELVVLRDGERVVLDVVLGERPR